MGIPGERESECLEGVDSYTEETPEAELEKEFVIGIAHTVSNPRAMMIVL